MVGEEFRPFVETKDVWFDTGLSFDIPLDDAFDLTSPRFREPIGTYANSIIEQQPEIDAAGGEVIQFEQSLFRTQRGSQSTSSQDAVAKIVNVSLDMPFDEVTVVFSHIGDAQRTVERQFDNVQGGDSRVVQKGTLRNQRDFERSEGQIVDSLPLTNFL